MASIDANVIKNQSLPQDLDRYATVDVSDILDDYLDDLGEQDDLDSKLDKLHLETPPPIPPRPKPTQIDTTSLTPSSVTTESVSSVATPLSPSPASNKSFWKSAVDETLHFAGGLVSHPFEATKHFSILRHSSGLVYYKGPATRIVITVFSDAPLPQDRSLWLQRKGYSGNLGMSASVLLGTSGNWIEVTPSSEALGSDVPEQDERAWQRDMGKFQKKGAKHKTLCKHAARETCIVRIPAVASDGYLRIVMCTGGDRKKVLCPSPVFRIASTSSDVSVFRGASLTTMPLEAGLKVASVVGSTVANRYIGPVRSAVTSQVQRYTDKYKPGFIAQQAGQIAYSELGVQNKVNLMEENYGNARNAATYGVVDEMKAASWEPEIIGADSGPEKPFPIDFTATVVRCAGQGQSATGIPTANLTGVPSDLLLRLRGIYLGWICVQPRKGIENISHDWHESIITIGPSLYAAPAVVSKNVANAHIIHDFGIHKFYDAKVKVLIMAPLRPLPRPDRSRSAAQMQEAVIWDIETALLTLSREHWGPQMALRRMKTEKDSRSMTDRYVNARTQFQKRVDSIPMHLAGVRTTGAEMMDNAYGRGGLYIRR
ncbi:hypothetical protein BX600DRAFT_206217 [Xylariales sp. PMI_506]|nr:hypothetical protein BX600DRAFT_206217 [Xylariales sp. PMI_506]